jgi:penicillin-binding protein 1C
MAFTKIKRVFLVTIICQLLCFLIFLIAVDFPSDFSSLDVTSFDRSAVVLDVNGKILNVYLSKSDELCLPISLDKMGRWTSAAAIALEDKRFYEHGGLDILAIARAFWSNITSGRRVSGASTITSQLIRISLPRERTIYNKILEFWSAVRLEAILSKDEILELYLNRAPFGGNIRGIEAASNAYFNKNAESLSLGESVILISLLRSPSRFRPDRYPDRARDIRNDKLDYLLEKGLISSKDVSLAKSEILPAQRYPIPSNASMAAGHAINQSQNKSVIASAIDSNLQLLLEKNIADALQNFPSNITGAGIIVENSSGYVRAYVGNSRHGTSLPEAQVDCGDAMRSPGSTLKSFIYAATFEKGLLTPASLIADTPIAFRGSAPRNFDMSYRGPVSARNALASSLNAPAVRVLRMVGYAGTKTVLNRFGFSHINKDPLHYTDSLILGGCEVTLIELASAYRALAQGGNYSPLHWVKDASLETKEILSSEASYITTNILQDQGRMMPIYQEIFRENNRRIAFKTGTSYGMKDAWSAGYSNNYTVVIWVGSPPGVGHQNLVGLQAATPVMLKIIRELWNDSETIPTRPPGVYIRTVCSLSGDLPNKYCPQTETDLAIRGVSRIKLCSLHRNIDGRSFVAWPQELRNWMRPYEETTTTVKKIKIIRPSPGHTVILQKPHDVERIFLSAEGDYPQYWYLDGKFVGVCENDDGIFADVSPGVHKASVLSGETSDTVSFEVKAPNEIRRDSIPQRGNIIN